MLLQPRQTEQFARDGILFFPRLLSPDEMTGLRERPARSPRIGTARNFAGETFPAGTLRLCATHVQRPLSPSYSSSTYVEPVWQLLGGEVYLHQFSINPKAAFEGEAWGWHQD